MNIQYAPTPNTNSRKITHAKSRLLKLVLVAGVLFLGAHTSAATTINVPGDYPTIQAAVNAANPLGGDTIVVAAGIYNENLIINKRVSIQGAGSGVADTVIMSAAANIPVIILSAGGDNATDRLVIQDVRITGASGSSGHLGSGIALQPAVLGFLTFDNIAVVQNSGTGIDIDLFAALNDIVIRDSTLSNNGGSGFRAPASSLGLNGLEIDNSHFDFNAGGGFTAYSFSLTNWNIRNSTFNDNVGPDAPYSGGYGMYIEGHIVNDITIECSEFNRNIGSDAGGSNISAGLVLLPFVAGDTYSNITIKQSQFNDNPLFGILVQPSADTQMQNIVIECDAFERNGYGVYIFDPGVITGFTIHHSNFEGNTFAGLENDNAATIDATKNWWGDASGPSAFGPGSGDAIINDWPGSGEVFFDPWRATPSACPSACTPAPAITIVKKTNGTDNDVPTGPIVEVGSTVNWTYEVTNTGNVPLSNVVVTDDHGVIVTCPSTTLADGESMICTGSGSAVAGQYTNIGSVTGTPPTGPNVIAENPDNYFGSSPGISIVKKTNGTDNNSAPGILVPAGSPVTWTYFVVNTGNVALTNVVVTDNIIGAITCPGTSLAVGANMTCSANGTAVAGQYTNIGTVTGQPPVGSNVTASNPDNYYGSAPGISILKKTNGTNNDVAPGPTVAVGSTVTWTYLVTNTGNVPLSNVNVTDNIVGAITCPLNSLAVGGSMTCTKTGTAIAGQYTNIGTVSGTPPVGSNVTASNPDNYFGQVTCPIAGTLNFTGNSSTYGTAGNIRTFTLNTLNVHASAFSRIRSNGAWNTAYVGSYTGGLGVTDGSEGNGGNNTHKIDNIGGRDNYVLLEFSQTVVIDQAFLDYLGADSDIKVWIGTKTNPYTSHLTLSDSLLSGMYTEMNLSAATGSRWADLNATQVSGNVVIFAADTTDQSPEDAFKLSKLIVGCPPPPVCNAGTFVFAGNTATSGTAGNTRTFTLNGVTVNVTAFSRADSGGAWATSYLGLYSGGLGVTDSSEGSGGNNTHKVDNLGGRNNYVLFEFSAPVVVDQAFLDIIGADSDMSAWIGTKIDPINNHLTLSDGLLSSLGPREDNTTTSTASRWANINAGNVAGNVLVISAKPGDTTLNDAFKISKLQIKCP